MKYDRMLARNREVSKEKIDRAKREIANLLEAGEPVTVAVLVKKTGLSREFFYKNEIVRETLMDAREQQNGMVFQKPQKAILDQAMSVQLETVKKQLAKALAAQESLQAENSKLQKALKKKELNVLRNL